MFPDGVNVQAVIDFLMTWLNANVLSWATAIQWACVALSFLLTSLIWHGAEKRLSAWVNETVRTPMARSMLQALVDIGNVAGLIVLLQISAAVFSAMEMPNRVLNSATNLGVAWIVARLLTSIMPNRTLAKLVRTVVWVVAALSIFELLAPITGFLEGLRFSMGGASFTALGAIKGLGMALLCLQLASLASQFATRRIHDIDDLSPSLQVLLIKINKVILFTGAILFAMASVGIDLTSLAIFSSALGVGIGFGLQTVFSNYVAGVLLLMDNSIKPGDTIEVSGVFGVVREMHGRYTSILTRDGKEYLIPNEQLVTGEVVNWTFSDSNIRIKIPVGVSYGSDVPRAMALMEEAARGVHRVLRHPEPVARLSGFGDNSVDLDLRIWIADADQGVANVQSDVLLKIWELFHEYGVEFPFPQRDVLLKPDSHLKVTIEKDGDQ